MNARGLGIFLIAAGLVSLVSQAGLLSGNYFLVSLGVVFLAAYFIGGYRSGFLVAGSIIFAVGLFSIVDSYEYAFSGGYLFFLFLALAFLGIYVGEKIAGRTSDWPLYPAVGLLGFSGFIYAAENDLIADAFRFWPVLLIVIGLLLLIPRRK